ncbi:UNVERIFIED_CONTAM: putative RDD family membrane protein YckC [Acetivibrio alkalicellulosi]
MRKILEILTPENVHVQYELAGLGTRFAAFLVDFLIQSVMLIITLLIMFFIEVDFGYIILDLGIVGFVSFVTTLILFFHLLYFIIFEAILKGQTPGKKLMKIRVIMETGQPINFIDCLIRGILRLVASLPLFYLIDSLFVIMSKNYKRIGDFAANTIVIKLEKHRHLEKIEDYIDMSPKETDRAESYVVSSDEYNLLKDFLLRKDNLGERRPAFEYNLNKYFMKKFNLETPYSNPYVFFEEIIRKNN